MRDRPIAVVGAGFAGSVLAERLAAAGRNVQVFDRRPHIAGNAYDERDAHGVLVHLYGPHIFHTSSLQVVRYLSSFTPWRFYEHRVRAMVLGKTLPIPINRTTINELYGLNLDSAGVERYLESVRVPAVEPRTSEELVLDRVGRELCDLFFRGYTKKQWGLDLAELSHTVAGRIPVRFDDDDRYFTDDFQMMPLFGYTRLFENILDHPRIRVRLNEEVDAARDGEQFSHVFYTGPIDQFFGYCFGRLPYRSLRFDHQHLADVSRFQEVGTVNYPNEEAFTRITEFRHLTGERGEGTSIVREYPQATGDPYYPIPTPANLALFERYKELGRTLESVTFVGRLAQYRYYNMDQVVLVALKTAERFLKQ